MVHIQFAVWARAVSSLDHFCNGLSLLSDIYFVRQRLFLFCMIFEIWKTLLPKFLSILMAKAIPLMGGCFLWNALALISVTRTQIWASSIPYSENIQRLNLMKPVKMTINIYLYVGMWIMVFLENGEHCSKTNCF